MKPHTYGSASLHMGPDVMIGCHTYPDSGPILYLSSGHGLGLTLHVAKHGHVSASDVFNARELAEAVGVFVAEVERLHARNTQDRDGDGNDGRDAAA